MSRLRNTICHASGIQLKVWLVRKHSSCLGMQLKHPVYKKLYSGTSEIRTLRDLAKVSLFRRCPYNSCNIMLYNSFCSKLLHSDVLLMILHTFFLHTILMMILLLSACAY